MEFFNIKKKIIIILLLFLVGLYALYNLFFDDYSSKYSNIKEFEKNICGGIVINNTSHPVKITDNVNILIIPPFKTSRNVGLFDADSIIIERPTIVRGKIYKYGVVKICDFSSIKVISSNGTDKIQESFLSYISDLFDRGGWYPSIKKAFKAKNNFTDLNK